MKIAIKDLMPNPYRKLKKYPLSKAKVQGLKTSIKENGFWGGLLVREHPSNAGKYQLAFGHHRLQAVKECGHKFVDNMIVFDLSDDDMHHRMFAENHETWGARPACILENVESARDWLTCLLKKYDTLSLLNAGENTNINKTIFDSNRQFKNCQLEGVGRNTIRKYLGDLYNENQVRDALFVLDESKKPNSAISIAAVKELPSMSHVKQFRQATERYEIPKKIQKRVAKEIVSEGVGRRGVEEIVAKHSPLSPAKKKELVAPKPLPMLDDFVGKLTTEIHDITMKLHKVKGNLDSIQSTLTKNSFNRECRELVKVLGKLGE